METITLDIAGTNKYIEENKDPDTLEIISDKALLNQYLCEKKVQLLREVLVKNGVTKCDKIISECVNLLVPLSIRNKIKLEVFVKYSNEMIESYCKDINLTFHAFRFPDGYQHEKLPTPAWSITGNNKVLIGYDFLKFNAGAISLLKCDLDDIIVVVPELKPIKIIKKKISDPNLITCQYQNTGKLVIFNALGTYIDNYFG